MDKQKLLQKLEESVSSLRQAIEENDGSTLKTLKTSAGQGIKSVRNAFAQNEKAQKTAAEIKKHLEDFELALEKGDKNLSGKLLAAAEKKIKQYKEKLRKDDCGEENNPPKQLDDSPPKGED